MKLRYSLLCLCALFLSASCEDTPVVDPRGPRPVLPGFKSDTCATEKDWPLCTDDDWGKKCPSGCRIQGLLDQSENEIFKKIQKLRNLLNEGKNVHQSTDLESKNTYNFLRERLVSNTGIDNRYATLAEQLRQRIVELKIKIDQQLNLLKALKDQIRTQFFAVQRLEVDIDIKLRSCKGSCASYQEFSVDKESYVALEKQLDRLDPLQVQNVETATSLKVLKIRRLKELDTDTPSIYKAGTIGTEREAQKKTFFADVGQLQLSLEAEGSTADTAATVSKVITGTVDQTPISTRTETVSCTKTVRRITTVTEDGQLQEKYQTVSSGPGCDTIENLGISEAALLSAAKQGKELSSDGLKVKVTTGDSKSITTFNRGEEELGGFAEDFFQGLGSRGQDRKFSSSFTSSSSSKSINTGGSKGFNSDTKSITSTSSPVDFGDDLGLFLRGNIEDDLPDLHARSFKSTGNHKDESIAGVALE